VPRLTIDLTKLNRELVDAADEVEDIVIMEAAELASRLLLEYKVRIENVILRVSEKSAPYSRLLLSLPTVTVLLY
jgi:hypothetical protein